MQIIAGIHKSKKLFCPEIKGLRPTSGLVRGALFNICQLTITDALFLDLFAGVGAIGLEALSRGASKVTFVEKETSASGFIKKNIDKLQENQRSRLLTLDVTQALTLFSERGEKFDIIFADPPYGKGETFLSNQILALIDSLDLLKEGGELFLEDDYRAGGFEPPLKNLKVQNSRTFGHTLLRKVTKT